MRLFKKCTFLIVLFVQCYCVSIFGQNNRVVQTVDTIFLYGQSSIKSKSNLPSYQWKTDSIPRGQSVAQLIESQSSIYIKNYGANSLSTISIRGGSSSQSNVLWNGVPITSPMLGIIDISLLPADIFNQVNVYQGGESSLWGSGTIAGYLDLVSQPDYTISDEIYLGTSFGNYGLLTKSIGLKMSRSKWEWKNIYFSTEAVNDFAYKIDGIDEVFNQKNARNKQGNLLSELYFTPNGNNQLSIRYWKQWSRREIPPTTTQNNNFAFQTDHSNRVLGTWKSFQDLNVLETKIALITDRQHYIDSPILIDSKNNFQSYFFESGVSILQFSHSKIYLGVSSLLNKAQTVNYKEDASLKRSAAILNFEYKHKKIRTQLSLRQEVENGSRIPVNLTASLGYKLTTDISISGKVSRNYRSPTLNDLYWNPGGNLALKSESGWSEEVNVTWIPEVLKKSAFKINVVAFNRVIDNWILWAISDNSNFFAPSNIAQVWSRGIESSISMERKYLYGTFLFNSGYTLLKSTNQIAIVSPRIDKGEQLVYTPEHKAFVRLAFRKSKTYLSLSHHFTSAVSGFNEDVSSYWIGNLYASKDFTSSGKKEFSVFIKCNNIWNHQYRIVERRPMPGFNFEFGISHKILNNNN